MNLRGVIFSNFVSLYWAFGEWKKNVVTWDKGCGIVREEVSINDSQETEYN